ncbi:MAG: CAP domain-containing protein [Pirellulaceae bacterium]|nr:CAP domain-containing protein [Pirellulaceae bacterium]
MRTSLTLAALLLAPMAFASLAVAQESTESQGGGGDPTAQAEVQLHRHPTLFGMLRRNNEIRRGVGLRPHRMNPALTKAAQDHANYMAQTGQFSHYVNGGHQYRANKYGFRGGVRENIAMGTGSVAGAFGMWQNSGGHYASIVSGTTEAGFGYAVGPNGTPYWVGVYGSPAQGDVTGESEEEVAKAIAERERKDAERNAGQAQGEGNAAGGNASGSANPAGGNNLPDDLP